MTYTHNVGLSRQRSLALRSAALTLQTLALLSLAACGGADSSGTTPATTDGSTGPDVTTAGPRQPANRAPVVSSANAAQTTTVGVAYTYDASKAGSTFTDADGDSLTYALTVSPANSGLTTAAAVISGSATTAGNYSITVTANDGKGGVTSNVFTLTIAPAPVVRAPALPASSFLYADASINLPRQFTTGAGNPSADDNTPANNLTSNAGATLGRVLFYDKRLSINDTVSCGSCHVQSAGFSDPRRFSVGFQGGLTTRASMSLANARYYQNGRFFWDERSVSAEAQVLVPIQNTTEMGNSLPQLVAKLGAVQFYGPLFTAAFGDPAITSDRISRALAQYVRAIVSYRSKYDSAFTNGVANFPATLTAQEEQGRQIFEGAGRCDTCHGTNAHVANAARNNGLDATVIDAGAGNGRFKSPSLRNIAVSAPFMHDGRFATLAEVVDHYDHGVQDSPNLAPQLRNPDGSVRRLNLSTAQKAALIAFLGTLTDNALLSDPKFSDPFPP
jgi:cytochrome c peroxidase